MKKLTVVLAFAAATTLVSGAVFAEAKGGKSPKPITKKADVICVTNTVLAVEQNGVFVFLDDKGNSIACHVGLQRGGDHELEHSPVGENITLPNGAIVKKDKIMGGTWIWVFVKNK